MKKLNWTEDNLSGFGRNFLRKVLGNMRDYSESTVRFGETGQGIQPNYQITFPNNRVLTINGSSHKQFSSADEFDENRISSPFTYEQIKKAYQA